MCDNMAERADEKQIKNLRVNCLFILILILKWILNEFWMNSGWIFRTLIIPPIFLVLPTRQNHPWNWPIWWSKMEQSPQTRKCKKKTIQKNHWNDETKQSPGIHPKIHSKYITKFTENSSPNSHPNSEIHLETHPKFTRYFFVFFICTFCHVVTHEIVTGRDYEDGRHGKRYG